MVEMAVPPLKRGSERGGFRGQIAPPPHAVEDNAHEQMMLVYGTNESDPASSPDTVYADLMKQVTE